MNTKILGGVLLIVGTSIGGGMLALPISTAPSGFVNSSLLLLACWVIMTFSAFLILEVNLWLPQNSNLISMIKTTLGNGCALIAWFSYLLLFYCLLAAYISSGTDILHHFTTGTGISIPAWPCAFVFVGVLGWFIYRGIQSVDYLNRALMFTKLAAYFLLVLCAISYVHPTKLPGGEAKYLLGSITVIITSFGFASIVPSLRSYLQDDVAKLRTTILIGSLIPLICYILWDLIILGTLPRSGEYGLINMITSGHSTTDIPRSLSHFLNNSWVTVFASTFTSVCVATSFLGVSLAMSDFLADGFSLEKVGKNNILIYSATFGPPIAIALFYPNAFIKGLSYAGVFCTLLLALFPPLMAWYGRYKKNISHGYEVVGGKISLLLAIIVAFAIIGITIVEDLL
jgi:tyrosine-specific transport protein